MQRGMTPVDSLLIVLSPWLYSTLMHVPFVSHEIGQRVAAIMDISCITGR